MTANIMNRLFKRSAKATTTDHVDHSPVSSATTRSQNTDAVKNIKQAVHCQKTDVRVFEFDRDHCKEMDFTHLDQVLKSVDNTSSFTWIDIQGLSDVDQIKKVCAHWKVHPLVVTNMYNQTQHAKINMYDEYIYAIVMACPDELPVSITSQLQVNIILTKDTLITIRDDKIGHFRSLRDDLKVPGSRIRQRGVDYLCYTLIDLIIDHYFDLVSKQSDMVEQLEDSLIDNPNGLSLNSIYKIKRQIMELVKIIQPTGTMLGKLLREQSPFISDSLSAYIHDLYDHTERLNEKLDMQREMITSMLDIYLSSMGNKMNEVMQVLTIYATIFIPLSFLTGVFGMNFKHMPFLEWEFGYIGFWVVTAVIVWILLRFFRKRKWL